MKLFMFSVRDAKSEVFGRPFFVQSLGVAVRSFEDEVSRDHPENTMHRHPGDFSLWALGKYDDADGTFEPEVPKLVLQATEVLKRRSPLGGLDA